MAKILKVKKAITEYTVVLDTDELKAIMHVMGSTSEYTKKKYGCNTAQAIKGADLYFNFLNQLNKDGFRV